MPPSRPPRRPAPTGEDTSVRLTELLRREAVGTDGSRLGRIADITITHGSDRPEIARVLIRGAHGVRAVDGDLVDLLDDGQVRVRCTRDELDRLGEPELAPTELRLDADVVDAQIVDLTGHHLVRAGDVVLAEMGDDILVVGVEVDFGAVLRRLGLRRLARHVQAQVVPWGDLHLSSRRGHQVQLESSSAHLARRSPVDMAHLLARVSAQHAAELLDQAPDGGVAAIGASHDAVGARLLASLPEPQAEEVLDALPPTRASQLRAALAARRHRRRLHRTHGWKRHAPGSTGGA